MLSLLLLLCLLSGCQVFKGDKRVAFLGDSITQGWAYPAANFGIFGNTSQQMLERDAAVLAGHGYAKVVILGGTNDVLLGIEPAMTVSNLEKIALSVQRSGAEPVLCEIPPIFHSLKLDDDKDYSNDVLRLNRQIVRLAAEHRWRLVDLLRSFAIPSPRFFRRCAHEAKGILAHGNCTPSRGTGRLTVRRSSMRTNQESLLTESGCAFSQDCFIGRMRWAAGGVGSMTLNSKMGRGRQPSSGGLHR